LRAAAGAYLGANADMERGISSSLGKLRAAAGAYLGANAARSVVQYSDSYKTLEGRLKSVIEVSDELQITQNKLFKIAQTTGTELGAVTNSFVTMKNAMTDVQAAQYDFIQNV
jgi:hypothetical protein